MNIVKWNPFRELEEIQGRLNRFFDETPLRPKEGDGLFFAEWAPAVDIEETDKEYLIKAELPDVAKENVKVELLDGVLTIEGERKREGGKGEEAPSSGAVVREIRSTVRAADRGGGDEDPGGVQGRDVVRPSAEERGRQGEDD